MLSSPDREGQQATELQAKVFRTCESDSIAKENRHNKRPTNWSEVASLNPPLNGGDFDHGNVRPDQVNACVAVNKSTSMLLSDMVIRGVHLIGSALLHVRSSACLSRSITTKTEYGLILALPLALRNLEIQGSLLGRNFASSSTHGKTTSG